MSSSRSLRRLNKEFERIKKNEDFFVCLENDENFHKWIVTYTKFDKDTNIYKQFQKKKMDVEVVLEFTMDNNYPKIPPKARILEPIFTPGYSFVLEGGAICMDVLSPNHWSPMLNIETCIYSIISLLSENNLENKIKKKGRYTTEDGEHSFKMLKNIHSEWWNNKRRKN